MRPGPWGRSLFAPVTFEWARHGTQAWRQAWQAGLGERAPAEQLGATPLLMQPRLVQRLNERAQALTAWLHAQRGLWQRPDDPPMDVISADLALVLDPGDAEGWDLRWVEFQAFTSVGATMDWLHELAVHQWPETAALDPHGTGLSAGAWAQAWRTWVSGGHPADQVRVLEHQPQAQRTRWDFVALAQRHGWALIEPDELQPGPEGLRCRASGQPVAALLNRLVPNHYPGRDSDHWAALQRQEGVHWHSAPALFERVHKGLMPAWHAQDPTQRVEAADAADWESLGLPPEALVLKPCLGFGGEAVALSPDRTTLRDRARRAAPGTWIVQALHRALPVLEASDGVPLALELRLILDPSDPAAPICRSRLGRLRRLEQGGLSSARAWQGLPGQGLALLLSPYPAQA